MLYSFASVKSPFNAASKAFLNKDYEKWLENIHLSKTNPTYKELKLREKLGWDINLSGLKYWIRGAPEPDVEYGELLLDDHGRLSEMKQSNFTIRVLRYNKKDGLFLPKKIFIKGKDIQLKLVINEWGIY